MSPNFCKRAATVALHLPRRAQSSSHVSATCRNWNSCSSLASLANLFQHWHNNNNSRNKKHLPISLYSHNHNHNHLTHSHNHSSFLMTMIRCALDLCTDRVSHREECSTTRMVSVSVGTTCSRILGHQWVLEHRGDQVSVALVIWLDQTTPSLASHIHMVAHSPLEYHRVPGLTRMVPRIRMHHRYRTVVVEVTRSSYHRVVEGDGDVVIQTSLDQIQITTLHLIQVITLTFSNFLSVLCGGTVMQWSSGTVQRVEQW